MVKLLLGKPGADKVLSSVKRKISHNRKRPCLSAILVGHDKASLTYVRIKERACQRVGIDFKKYLLPENISESKIAKLIKKINNDKRINGLIIQLPLPRHLNQEKITRLVSPEKDVDGFVVGTQFVSPVYQGIIFLIKQSGLKLKNKKAVILSNSYTFADPLAKILLKKKVSTDIIVVKKLNPGDKKIIKKADIIISALGRSHFIKPNLIKNKSLIIDIGFSHSHGKLCGDASPFCQMKAGFVSPVPGGIGPLTVAFLLKNLTTPSKTK
ncbi:MAG: bifunctional 5,10-methylenetetrahydrofolate dehydrogenase/5,10-methenyltetrahydrofolate cyclohydrolase [Patescibacteria group bacterium]|nr:bifunctional 5,10-methylenetetrahydrofolate dehydrogenase/5,10-methenyltetrahydrofolate cyclohydrolase [Patescibacteria group bacterium]MDD5121417.1 bifunctional 5,10-methylenetetrahydrofolate dehydrogenase/5,10-methenyltetrahydrofolate cyclohydrolase [Patescibacteria group bacterium]MDD5221857.1 bifunctional 5,10-methylenetetrahydrofolate dehydrogenase/5,10-methenyltetrahydrofolate cyclohydrolase [Patescibacteria group bacterium]MDD5395664.1 bifunctional 5,10-methylenetetrahydrofolate dehydr